jgi:hypothetical protein
MDYRLLIRNYRRAVHEFLIDKEVNGNGRYYEREMLRRILIRGIGSTLKVGPELFEEVYGNIVNGRKPQV